MHIHIILTKRVSVAYRCNMYNVSHIHAMHSNAPAFLCSCVQSIVSVYAYVTLSNIYAYTDLYILIHITIITHKEQQYSRKVSQSSRIYTTVSHKGQACTFVLIRNTLRDTHNTYVYTWTYVYTHANMYMHVRRYIIQTDICT